MRRSMVLTVVGILVTIVVVYSVEAKLSRRWWKRPAVATKLKLEDDQLQAIEQAALNHRMKAIELRARLKQYKETVEYLLQQDPIESKAVIKASEEVAGVRTEMLANRIDERLAMRGHLTPLQQEKVEEMVHHRPRKAEKKGRRKKAHGRKDKVKRFFKSDVAGKWWENPEVAADVGLTKEQIQGLIESSYKIGRKQIELRAQKEIKELSLKSAMDNPEVDRKAIDGIIKEIGEIGKAIARNRAELMIAERETLTGEQFDKLKAVKIEEAKERREFLRELALKRPAREKRPTGRRCRPGDEA